MPAPARTLADLPALEGEDVLVVIETPQGSANKLGFDHALGAFRLKAELPRGTVFPFDFGFVPSTLAEDGDPLDVLVFLDAPVPTGCVVAVRLIGAVAVRQREGERWVNNDRLLGVATQSHASRHVAALDDLRPGLLDEVEAFFSHYVRLQGRDMEIAGRRGPDEARALLEAAMRRAAGRG